jgi:1,4-dihydroxy-2-naphthoate octaprenyltransferase
MDTDRTVRRSRIAPPARSWQRWWIASRPRTLAMAITPVVAGACLAWSDGAPVRAFVFALTLGCAVLIQAGTNLLNDVADHEKGNDGADRVGPLRITAAGWATPSEVRRAACLVFAAVLLLGLPLVSLGGLPILVLGLCSIAAGWAYSGGARPVSYRASGELFVLVFFGVVAVTGTYYLQAHAWSPTAVATGAAVGAIASAVLLVNNYRDLVPDAAAGRQTLASVLGPARSRALYAVLMLAPLALPPVLALASPGRPGAWLACLAAPLLLQSVAAMRRLAGADLNAVLARTAFAQLLYGALLSIGVLI